MSDIVSCGRLDRAYPTTIPAKGVPLPVAHQLRFEALDSWRGIAAMMVALFHFGMVTHVTNTPIVYNASLFVDFFFVLSGFVLSHAYADALRQGMPFGNYVLRRIGRLWPLHVAVLAVLVAYEVQEIWLIQQGLRSPHPVFDAGSGRDVPLLVENIFLVQALGFEDRVGWNGPSWSISTELWVCLGFAALCIGLSRKRMLIAALAIVLISMLVLAIYSPTYMATAIRFAMFKCAAGFFVGHIVYRLRERFVVRDWGSRWELAAIGTMVAYLWIVDVRVIDPLTMLAPIVFGLVVWVFSFEAGAVSRALKVKPFLLLGTLSYSIYMVHDTISWRMGTYLRGCAVDMSIPGCEHLARIDLGFMQTVWYADLAAVVYLLLTVAVSLASYHVIEQPCRRAFNFMADRVWPISKCPQSQPSFDAAVVEPQRQQVRI